jgi:hypothetical protein
MKYTSGSYRSGYLLEHITDIEKALTETWKRLGMIGITDTTTQRDFINRIEDASFGKNLVRFDDASQPSIMVRFVPNREAKKSYLYNDSTSGVHQAFVIDSLVKPFERAKYNFGRVGSTNYPVNLWGLTPAHSWNFDQFQAMAVAKGAGWSLPSQAIEAYIALLSMRKAFESRGNTYFGYSHERPDEFGIMSSELESIGTRHTLTGTGPVTWRHDGTPFGVDGFVGNVWNWTGGYRLVDGAFQIIPDNNACGSKRTVAAHAAGSTEWREILFNGSLVTPEALIDAWADATPYAENAVVMSGGVRYRAISAHTSDSTTEPGTGASWETAWVREGTIHYIWDGAKLVVSDHKVVDSASRSITFSSLTVESGLVIPAIMQDYLLFPMASAPKGTRYANLSGERLPVLGGSRSSSSLAGLGAEILIYTRAYADNSIGAASAYVDPS